MEMYVCRCTMLVDISESGWKKRITGEMRCVSETTTRNSRPPRFESDYAGVRFFCFLINLSGY